MEEEEGGDPGEPEEEEEEEEEEGEEDPSPPPPTPSSPPFPLITFPAQEECRAARARERVTASAGERREVSVVVGVVVEGEGEVGG